MKNKKEHQTVNVSYTHYVRDKNGKFTLHSKGVKSVIIKDDQVMPKENKKVDLIITERSMQLRSGCF